jgi:hypothetical protein
MNKLISTLFLFLAASNLIQAEDGYIKYDTYSEYRSKTVKCFRGEIVPFIKSTKANKINVIINKDTIYDLPFPSKSFDTIQSPNTKYIGSQKDLVLLTKDGLVVIDASLISAADTVTLISENGTQLIRLVNPHEAQVRQAACGKTFRLLISNAPTLYYTTEKLNAYAEPDKPKDEPKTDSGKEKQGGFLAGLAWWHYLLFILALAAIGIVGWKIIRRKIAERDKEKTSVLYEGNSLKDFARDNGLTLQELIKLNKGVIDSNYENYNERDRKDCQKDLKGKKLLVPGQPKTNLGENGDLLDSFNSNRTPLINTPELSNKEAITQPHNQIKTEIITEQLQRIETVVREIRNSTSKGNDNSNALQTLNNKVAELEKENKGLTLKNLEYQTTINKINGEKSEGQSELDSLKKEKSQKVIEINQLQEKIIPVDYLTGYCDSVSGYLELCNQVSINAYDYFNRISPENKQMILVTGHLLMKFQSSLNSLPVGNWVQIVNDIKDSGVTNNKQIKSSFKQIESSADRKRQFQTLLFTEVLVKYSSSILILAEAFRNLGRFQISSELVNDIEKTFANHVSEILSKVKSTGIEIKYVPLFENYEEFLGEIESVDGERSEPYQQIRDLGKGSIAEIVSYGVKTFSDDTKTRIKLA